MTENEMVRWHHRLNGHEFEQTPEDCKGQGSLACCSLWGRKESDMTEWLNNNNNDSSIFKLEGNLQADFHMVVPTSIPTNSVQGFPFLHILADTCYLLITGILMDVRWYFIVSLICISKLSSRVTTGLYMHEGSYCSALLPVYLMLSILFYFS